MAGDDVCCAETNLQLRRRPGVHPRTRTTLSVPLIRLTVVCGLLLTAVSGLFLTQVFDLSGPGAVLAANPRQDGVLETGSFTGAYASPDIITIDTSGTPSGWQSGPYKIIRFSEADRGKTLAVTIGMAVSLSGASLPRPAIDLYRLNNVEVNPGDRLAAFGDGPARQLLRVARSMPEGQLRWPIEPGSYLVFFPRAIPVVRVSQAETAGYLDYRINVE